MTLAIFSKTLFDERLKFKQNKNVAKNKISIFFSFLLAFSFFVDFLVRLSVENWTAMKIHLLKHQIMYVIFYRTKQLSLKSEPWGGGRM